MTTRHTRRQFLQIAVAAAATTRPLTAAAARAPAWEQRLKPLDVPGLVDTNVTLGRWPFRGLPLDQTPALVATLRRHGVTQAWAGSFEALFHKDLAAANARLAAECRRHGRGLLIPFGSVNPAAPGWEDDLQRCQIEHHMPGLRLYPTYHGYRLDEPVVAELLARAQAAGLMVQIVADMEDERTQHPLARVPHLDAGPLPALLRSQPGARVMVVNAFRSVAGPLVVELAAAGACFEIATLENVGGVARLLRQLPAGRVLFGSHAPLFYFESALLKLRESALGEAELRAVCATNARGLLRP